MPRQSAHGAVSPDDAGKRDSYDIFISYADEDRPIAERLAGGLTSAGFAVWYDQFELRAGDRILDRINEGLTRSAYGLLVVTTTFLAKPWPQYETDVLVREYIEGKRELLPVWHEVDQELVRKS